MTKYTTRNNTPSLLPPFLPPPFSLTLSPSPSFLPSLPTYLHAAVHLMHSIHSSNGIIQHHPRLYLMPHISQAHFQQANHLGDIATHGTEFIQEPVAVFRGEVTQTVSGSWMEKRGIS